MLFRGLTQKWDKALQFVSYWPETSHMTIPNCKGAGKCSLWLGGHVQRSHP